MQDMQLLLCCHKETDHQLQDVSSATQAVVPLFCSTKDMAEVQEAEQEVQEAEQEAANGKKTALLLAFPTKRRSCALVNTPSPCVNKAIYHIEALENRMKEWLDQSERMLKEEKALWFSYAGNDIYDYDVPAEESQKLHVVGVGLLEPVLDAGRTALLKLETEGVVTEVVGLIWRLEADRQEAAEAFDRERQLMKTLSFKVDKLSFWRLEHLGVAVQKEHERCAWDITELHWHIARQKQELQKIAEQIQKLEAANAKLLEDVRYVEKHGPLLVEKLNLENEALDEIRKAQAEATEVFNGADQEQQEAQELFDKCTAEANAEREIMSEDLELAKATLDKCIADVNDYEDLYSKTCVALSESEQQLRDLKQLLEDLLKQRAAMQEKRRLWKSKVQDMECTTEAQEILNADLSKECDQLTKSTISTKSFCEGQILELEKELHIKLHAFRCLQDKIKELEILNEDLESNIKESLENKERYIHDILRMQKTIKRSQEQYLKTTADLAKIRAKWEATKIKLEEMGGKSGEEESRMKNLTEILKKQSADEIKATQLIQARSSALLADLKRKQMESKKRRQEMDQMAIDCEKPMAEMLTSVRQKRKSQTDLTEKCCSLRKNNQELKEKQSKIYDELGKRKCALQQQLTETQGKNTEVFNELNDTIKGTEKFQSGILEMGHTIDVMKRVKETTDCTITELTKDFDSVDFKQQNATHISDHLTSEIERIRQKMQTEQESHLLHLDCRKKTLKKHQSVLDVSLIENRKLASKYKALQRIYLQKRDSMLDLLEKRVRLEGAVRDRTQLSVLQHRMHRAMLEYFRLRGLHCQAGLATCQAASRENAQKILAVQEEMSKTIQQVSAFVNSLTDGASAESCRANEQAPPDADREDSQSHTVQKTV